MTCDRDMMALYEDMVIERYNIWTRRQKGHPGPWTTNPVLSRMKMTNMFRVLDPGSQFVFWLGGEDPVDVIARLVFYRITNRPETWYALRNRLHGRWPDAKDFTSRREVLLHHLREYRDEGNQVFSGAYVIIPEPGTTNDKVDGAYRVTRNFVLEKAEAFLNADTQEDKFRVLKSTPGLGPFLSMQVLTDWNYLQPEEPEEFVVAGPGAKRGAAHLSRSVKAEHVIKRLAYDLWLDHSQVNLYGRGLTVMDVQNTMCEFGKYVREIRTPRKNTPYQPAHPGPQKPPIVPTWW